MIPNIVLLESYPASLGDLSWSGLELLGNLTIYEQTNHDEIVARAKDADILVTNKVKLTADILDQLPKLKLVQQLATGTDNIDVSAAKNRGIQVRNVVGYSTSSVAQHVFALLTELANYISIHNAHVQDGGWSDSGNWCQILRTPVELSGKYLGIIGFGRIGQEVAKVGAGLGMKILVYSRHSNPRKFKQYEFTDLDRLIARSDVISIHTALTDETKGMVDATFLSNMKSNAYLINTARGGHVVEADLRDALLNNRIAGAGLDVLSQEPPPADHLLIGLPNCVITPHIAWTSFEARKRLINIAVESISDFIKNKF